MTAQNQASGVAHSEFAPRIFERPAHRYCALAAHCRRDELGAKVPALLHELLAWFERHGVTPSGAQLVRYLVVDYNTGSLNIEVGVPLETDKCPTDARIQWREIPAGRYVTLTHAGPYTYLVDTTASLLDWARRNRVVLDVDDHEKVTQWGCRVERYLVAPPHEMQPERWITEIAIRLSDRVGIEPKPAISRAAPNRW